MILGRVALGALALWTLSSCGGEQLPRVNNPPYQDTSLDDVIGSPARLNQALVHVMGWSRVEFEGNALYTDKDAFDRRDGRRAVWLDLGWPVDDRTRSLDGMYVVVDGRFQSDQLGHFGAYSGTITDIHRIEPVPETRQIPPSNSQHPRRP